MNGLQTSPIWNNLGLLLPDAWLAGCILLLTVMAALRGRNASNLLMPFTALAVIVFPVAVWMRGPQAEPMLAGALVSDGIAGYFILLFSIAALLMFAGSAEKRPSEFYPVFLTLYWGMSLMARSRQLMMMVVALEIVSVSGYGLAAFSNFQPRAAEAALKYLIYGAFSTAVSLYGISWLYGYTGSLNPYDPVFVSGLQSLSFSSLVLIFLLVLGMFSFKTSLFPFHFWAPDVYEGVPWSLAAFFSVGPKLAGFALLYRFCLPLAESEILRKALLPCLAAIAVASIVVGNLSALRQDKLRRLIAFSGIAQAGFALLAFLPMERSAYAASFFYLGVYLLMNYGLFYWVGKLEDSTGISKLSDLGKVDIRQGISLFSLVVFAAALTGLPGTAGFTGKLALFTSLLQLEPFWAWILIAVAALNILPSLYYYFVIPARVIFKKEIKNPVALPGRALVLPLFLALALIWLGIFHFGALIGFLARLV